MSSSQELLRATIFHTPHNPFSFEPGDPRALVCLQDGGLLVSEGRIAACDDFGHVRETHPEAVIVDRRGCFLLPGLIDAHVHFPQARIIGALGRSLLDWLDEIALPEEARLADTSYAASTAALFVRALAAHGTTTALVFGSHFSDATAELFEAALVAKLRIISGLVVSDRLLRDELHVSPERAYQESTLLIQRYHRRGRLIYAVTPRFAYSTSEKMLEVCQQLMGDHPDVRLQTHINENTSEIRELSRLFSWARDYLAIYERYGLSNDRSVMAHNVHATRSEIERIAAAGTAIAHCPASNASLGSGCFPLKRHLEAGVTCALGTDVGGGLGFGLLKEGLHAYLMQRLAPDPTLLSAAHLLFLSTGAGASALGLAGEIGDFAVGKYADFVILQPPAHSVLEAVVKHADTSAQALAALFSMAGAETVRETRVEGEVVFRRNE